MQLRRKKRNRRCIYRAGVVLCAKALEAIKLEREENDSRNWISENALDGILSDPRWQGGQPDTYRVAQAEDGTDEVRVCAGSPIGEVAFMSGELQGTVCCWVSPCVVFSELQVVSGTWPKHHSLHMLTDKLM